MPGSSVRGGMAKRKEGHKGEKRTGRQRGLGSKIAMVQGSPLLVSPPLAKAKNGGGSCDEQNLKSPVKDEAHESPCSANRMSGLAAMNLTPGRSRRS